jgi:hypothetical protein
MWVVACSDPFAPLLVAVTAKLYVPHDVQVVAPVK